MGYCTRLCTEPVGDEVAFVAPRRPLGDWGLDEGALIGSETSEFVTERPEGLGRGLTMLGLDSTVDASSVNECRGDMCTGLGEPEICGGGFGVSICCD